MARRRWWFRRRRCYQQDRFDWYGVAYSPRAGVEQGSSEEASEESEMGRGESEDAIDEERVTRGGSHRGHMP